MNTQRNPWNWKNRNLNPTAASAVGINEEKPDEEAEPVPQTRKEKRAAQKAADQEARNSGSGE
jgi:hypothetical protein